LAFSGAPEMATAFVLLNVDLGTEKEVLARLRKTEGVKEAHRVYGVYDIIARLEAESTEEVKGLLQERIRKIDCVRSSLTMLAV
jgi:DNA-binding Lrp family transcriptional regulator